MSRQGYSTSSASIEGENGIHPVWRGIGCLLVVIIPVMAYAAAIILMEQNAKQAWFEIPAELSQLPFPSGLAQILPGWVMSDFYAKVLVAIFFALVIFGLLTVIYSIAYRMGGGFRPSPVDAPPPRRKSKKSR